MKASWSGCGLEVLAPKRDVQARRAGAWAGVGSGGRVIVIFWVEGVVVVVGLGRVVYSSLSLRAEDFSYGGEIVVEVVIARTCAESFGDGGDDGGGRMGDPVVIWSGEGGGFGLLFEGVEGKCFSCSPYLLAWVA